MALLLKADGMQVVVRPKSSRFGFSLEELHELVGGDIEIVTVPDGRRLVVDEEGKLKGKPVNLVATLIAQADGLREDDVIVGDALLVIRPTELL